ncbi:hypothetical protein [Gimesia sp.]|uniref:hypothetical protein n=1 Tax=Gimesia sp. TaxID=2024833 RepID=UPI003A8ED3D7
MEEDPTLTPVFLEIFDLLNSRKDTLKWIGSLGAPEDESEHVIDKLDRAEVALLRSIVSLADAVESVFAAKGAPTSSTNLVRNCKPFLIACQFIESATDASKEIHVILRNLDADRKEGSIAEVIFAKQYNEQRIPQFGLALDLLQYWELLLRNESDIACDEFCRGVRQILSRRITTLLQYDSLLCKIPKNVTASPQSPLFDVLAKDITDRLERISIRLDQVDSLQNFFRSKPKTDFPRILKHKRILLSDELTVVLSELYHLSDNVRKFLKANNEDLQQLKFFEDLPCFHAAGCFVNTHKHGIRGRNKTSAFADYEIVIENEGKLQFVDLIINYKGNAWQACLLIEDLLQVWEIFIRYYTTIEFPDFRERIGSKFASKASLSTYTCELGESIGQDLERKSTERKQYNI